MAHNNVPAHDFAPAWLKIPTYDTYKPPGAEGERGSHTSRKDEHNLSAFDRRSNDSSSSSRITSYAESRRENRGALSAEKRLSYFPSRHHSIDIEDSQYSGRGNNSHPFGSTGLKSSSDSINSENSLSSSQPSLTRRPHSRHDFRDFSQHSFNKLKSGKQDGLLPNSNKVKGGAGGGGSNGSGNNSNGGGGGGVSGGKQAGFSSNNQKTHSSSSSNGKNLDVTSNNFNQEFPSLQGDSSTVPTSQPLINGSVWENPRKVHGLGHTRKIQLIQRSLKNGNSAESRSKSPPVVLLPAVSPSQSSSISNSVSSSIGQAHRTNSFSQVAPPVYRSLVPSKKSSSNQTSSSPHSMEILVKNPKTRGNKSEFLKALRNEAGGKEQNGTADDSKDDGKEGSDKNSITSSEDSGKQTAAGDRDEKECNGIDIKLSPSDNDDGKGILSSSLEAEQRLLREMGWKEEGSDDDAYAPLTEDELREFFNRTLKMPQKKNGIQQRNLQINWSPRRLHFSAAAAALPKDESLSSTSDSSDSDSN